MSYRFATPVLLPVLAAALTACTDFSTPNSTDAPNGPSRAFGAWSPGPNDTCTPAIHDRYAVVGPDGKLYPTWHPPVDPETGCTFGHEHGRDPRGSDLFGDVGDIPFGLANEAADLFAPHVGYKVEWENNVPMSVGLGDVGQSIFEISCDVMVELHQGSAGSGAFVNPSHELAFHARCEAGTELHITLVSTIGHAGEFVRSCDRDVAVVVAAPQPGDLEGNGRRLIPDRSCVEQFILVPDSSRSNFGAGLRESWQFSESIRSAEGRRLASINPYFNVRNPSRYYDPASPDLVGRPIDLCYEILPSGNRAQGGLCEDVTPGLTFDDPDSPFDGAHRDVDVNSIRISNADGPQVWYTDAFGKNGRTEPFAGSIRQFIARVDNDAVTPSGPPVGRDRDYGAPGTGVHPPN